MKPSTFSGIPRETNNNNQSKMSEIEIWLLYTFTHIAFLILTIYVIKYGYMNEKIISKKTLLLLKNNYWVTCFFLHHY